MYFRLKVRGPKDKVFFFLTPKNGKNRLKIHGVMIEGRERAEKLAKEIMDLNKGVQAKIVPVL
jgi:hypothetical protein